MAKKKVQSSLGKKVTVGAGVVALSGAAYLLFGPEGKKHRKDLKSWMLKMKAEALENMEEVKDLTLPAYEKIVTGLEKKYKAMKHVDAKDVAKEVAALKKNFRALTKPTSKKAKK